MAIRLYRTGLRPGQMVHTAYMLTRIGKLYPAPGRYHYCAGGSLTLSRYPETRVRLDDGTEYSAPGLLMLAIDCVGRGIWVPEIKA